MTKKPFLASFMSTKERHLTYGAKINNCKSDGVVKTLHLLRHCKFTVTATYLSTPHSIKFTFLEYEVFYLAIQNFTFYELVKSDKLVKT